MDHYAVIGNPIAHSKSPQIHLAFAQQEATTIDYQRILANAENFVTSVDKFKRTGGCGLNVTVPFKVTAFQQCTEVNEYARAAGAVNTLSFAANGNWIGANTDGVGLLRDLKSNLDATVTGAKILVIGAGGATRGILLPLIQETPESVVITNRTYEKAELLAQEFSGCGRVTSCAFDALNATPFNIIINATAASLSNDVPSISASVLHQTTLCYDLAYSDKTTAFLAWAQAHGVNKVSDGLGMLIEQAAESYFIWRNFRPDTAGVYNLLRPNR